MAKQSRQRSSSQGRSHGGQNWSQRNPSERSFGEERGRYSNTGDYRRSDYENYSDQESDYGRGQQTGYGQQRSWNPAYQTSGRESGGYDSEYRGGERQGWTDQGFLGGYRGGQGYQGSEGYQGGQGYRSGQGGQGYRGSEEYGRGRSQFGGSQWGASSRGEYGRGDYGENIGYGDQGNFERYEEDMPYSDYESRMGSGSRMGSQSGFGGYGQSRGWGGSSQSRSSSRSGQFTGRGPQGYRRSDERIQEDINEALTQHGDIDATSITVEVKNGEVTLRGTVSDREAKRMAEDVAENASGVKDVQNQLRVRREEESGESRQDRSEEGKRRQSAA